MKKLILITILIGIVSLLSIYVLNISGALNNNHIERVVCTRPYGKPMIGETYIINGEKYVGRKNAVIIAPTQHGTFIILDFKVKKRKETK
jgi:hypothetical protein